MKIAIMGTRGVPARYGGFETFAAELSQRLVARGHHVSVYCRDLSAETGKGVVAAAEWNGVQRIVLPALRHKYLETVSHTFLSAVDALRRDYDAILLCNAANAFVVPLLRAARFPVAINVDGVERKRRKWNFLGRAVYAAGETFSAGFATVVIADAEVIARYYREHYALKPATIPYGADFPDEADSDVLARLGLRTREYILYVSRFEPENNPLEVVEAYGKIDTDVPLLMVGKGLYATNLVAELQSRASEKVLLPGALYGADYRTLQRNALIYVQATEVGGTHPALIEAMGSGGCVLANDTPENREVGADSVGYFRLGAAETLSASLNEWLARPAVRERFRSLARQRAAEHYSWQSVVDAYESLLKRISP